MPRLTHDPSRNADVMIAINYVLAEKGIPGLTLRGISSYVQISPAALNLHYGSRERMLAFIANLTGEARQDRISFRRPWEGALAFLPCDPEDVVTARAWLGWLELARSAEWLTPIVDQAVDKEFEMLAESLDFLVARPDLERIRAVIDGLLVAMCRPTRPMSIPRAHEILTEVLAPHVAAGICLPEPGYLDFLV